MNVSDAVFHVLEDLEVLEPVAVDLVHVDPVLLGVADGHVAQHEAIGAVGADPHVLDGVGRGAVARLHPPGVDDDVVGAHARALELEVAAQAGPVVGDAVAVVERRLRRRRPGLAADDRDQLLVVGASRDVAVGVRAGLALVVYLLEPVAFRVVGRLRARRRLGVGARHHHHAVVVVRRRDRGLDLVELALVLELAVDPLQALALLLGEVAVVVGADVVAVLDRVLYRRLEQLHRVRLADDARLARSSAAFFLCFLTAEASERTVGTCPPAAGWIVVSAAGSGQ